VFSLAWWLFIDAVSQTAHINTSEDDLTVKPQLYLLGFGSTIAFFIISFMDFGALQADGRLFLCVFFMQLFIFRLYRV